jgi:hypothetical protein
MQTHGIIGTSRQESVLSCINRSVLRACLLEACLKWKKARGPGSDERKFILSFRTILNLIRQGRREEQLHSIHHQADPSFFRIFRFFLLVAAAHTDLWVWDHQDGTGRGRIVRRSQRIPRRGLLSTLGSTAYCPVPTRPQRRKASLGILASSRTIIHQRLSRGLTTQSQILVLGFPILQ